MSIASKNRKRKKRLRRLYENIVEAKLMRFAGEVLEARHEARIAKENEASARKAFDELVQRHLQVGIIKEDSGDQAIYAKWTTPRLSVALPRKRIPAWEMSRDAVYDLGAFIRDIPGFQLTWRQIIDELIRCNCLNEVHYLEMIADHIGHSVGRMVLQKLIEQARTQTTQEKSSAAIA